MAQSTLRPMQTAQPEAGAPPPAARSVQASGCIIVGKTAVAHVLAGALTQRGVHVTQVSTEVVATKEAHSGHTTCILLSRARETTEQFPGLLRFLLARGVRAGRGMTMDGVRVHEDAERPRGLHMPVEEATAACAQFARESGAACPPDAHVVDAVARADGSVVVHMAGRTGRVSLCTRLLIVCEGRDSPILAWLQRGGRLRGLSASGVCMAGGDVFSYDGEAVAFRKRVVVRAGTLPEAADAGRRVVVRGVGGTLALVLPAMSEAGVRAAAGRAGHVVAARCHAIWAARDVGACYQVLARELGERVRDWLPFAHMRAFLLAFRSADGAPAACRHLAATVGAGVDEGDGDIDIDIDDDGDGDGDGAVLMAGECAHALGVDDAHAFCADVEDAGALCRVLDSGAGCVRELAGQYAKAREADTRALVRLRCVSGREGRMHEHWLRTLVGRWVCVGDQSVDVCLQQHVRYAVVERRWHRARCRRAVVAAVLPVLPVALAVVARALRARASLGDEHVDEQVGV